MSQNPVRSDTAFVMDQATSVQVVDSEVEEFCQFLVDNFEFEAAEWDAPVFPNEKEDGVEDVVDYLIVGNALNYCFNDLDTGGKFETEYIGTEWRGAFGMWAALMKEYENSEDILDPERLKSITTEEVLDIFESSNGVQIPMPETRAVKLNSVGRLMEEFGGSFWNEFEDGSVTLYGEGGLVETLANSDAYQDSRTYGGEKVRFDKRAQLAVSMVYGKLLGTEFEFSIEDMAEFTVFADYGIPAGLATHGVIRYDDSLFQKVKNQQTVAENSKQEVEIRAATVVAVEKIMGVLESKHDVSTDIPVLDYVLWQMRRDAEVNVHLTETTSY